jgi:hypothetical protein
MPLSRTFKPAEYQDGDIEIVTREPLVGKIDLMTDDGIVQLEIDKHGAEWLVAALLEFLAAGEGDDAPEFTVHNIQ